MKKTLLLAVVMLSSLGCMADDANLLSVERTGGVTSYVLADIACVKYDGSDMIISMKDGTTTVIAIDDVVVMTFETADEVRNVFSDAKDDAEFVIADINGRVLKTGRLNQGEAFAMPEGKGLFLVTVGKQTKKVLVK